MNCRSIKKANSNVRLFLLSGYDSDTLGSIDLIENNAAAFP